jgi:formyl-CoA transferase
VIVESSAEEWPADPLIDDALPLASIRVLDLSRVLAGPLAAQTLADLGADVVKVERPGIGDETRRWGPPFHGADAAYFFALNRNRRSIELDLSTPHGAAQVRRLARCADIVIENFLPHQSEALGLEQLRSECPHTVWVSIRGASVLGPLGTQPGFDAMVQARTGVMSINGPDDQNPTKVGIPIVDIVTGLHAAHAALAALLGHQRDPTRPASHVEVPLLECGLSLLTNQAANYLIGGMTPSPTGNEHPNIAPYGTYATADRPIMIGAGTNAQFANLCAAIGCAALALDPEFATNTQRVAHRDRLRIELERTLTTQPSEHWSDLLAGVGVPVAPINTIAEALAEPHVTASGILQTFDTDHGPLSLIGCPITLDEQRPHVRRLPPALGEHNELLLNMASTTLHTPQGTQ